MGENEKAQQVVNGQHSVPSLIDGSLFAASECEQRRAMPVPVAFWARRSAKVLFTARKQDVVFSLLLGAERAKWLQEPPC